MEKLLLLEDDPALVRGLTFAFQKQEYETETAQTIREAKILWQAGAYDLLVLDVSLPDGSGFEFCKYVRQSSKVPMIFLTASDEETQMIMGLDMGADDYITKPFKLGVLLSRIHALLRRAKAFQPEASELVSHGIRVKLLEGQVLKKGVPVELTAVEYKLLCFFMRHPNQILTKDQILERLWDCDGAFIDNNTLTVYVRRLRMKIEEDPGDPKRIRTVRGVGYQWNDMDD